MFDGLSLDERKSLGVQLRGLWRDTLVQAGFSSQGDERAAISLVWQHPLSLRSFDDPHTPDSLVRAVKSRFAIDNDGIPRRTSPSVFLAMSEAIRRMAWDTVIEWRLLIEAECALRLPMGGTERAIAREQYRETLWQGGDAPAPHRAV